MEQIVHRGRTDTKWRHELGKSGKIVFITLPNLNMAIMLFFGTGTYLKDNQRTVQEVDSAGIAKTQETKMQS